MSTFVDRCSDQVNRACAARVFSVARAAPKTIARRAGASGATTSVNAANVEAAIMRTRIE